MASALFCDREELAKKQLETTKARLSSQLQPDGSQPHELARTLSWNYSNMDLYGFILLTRLAEHVSVDLWKYQTADGQGIHKAIDWLVPYAAQEKKWTYQQIEPGTNNLAARIFDVAHHQYGAEVYGTLARKLDPDLEQDLSY